MNTHGVYVSFSVLVESAALLLALLLVGLAAFSLPGLVLWFLLALLLVAAGVYAWRLWSLRYDQCYGLWMLEEEEAGQ